VISPLLANLFLNWFDRVFHGTDGPLRFANARLIRFADDFVVMARYVGDRIVTWTESWLEGRFGLTINREKTKVVDVKQKGRTLDFLGYSFRYDKDLRGRDFRYWNRMPSKESMRKARFRIHELTSGRWCCLPIDEVVRRLNMYLRSWSNYFGKGYPRMAFRSLNYHVLSRMIQYLHRQSQRPFRPPEGTSWYDLIYKELGVYQF
jgi:RNA-directed DNA polymerase